MSNQPPDQAERERALHPGRSILVQAPAGSGKTDLLTRRFLRLLSEVQDPSHVVAITFTKAAASEMRHRIVFELEKAESNSDVSVVSSPDEFSMQTLAARALQHSQALAWNLLDLPSQLNISTIDSFCRDLAVQQPLLSGLGGILNISEQPQELYRLAARRTLQQLADDSPPLHAATLNPAIEALLLWRDNGWYEMENQLVSMLQQRDRWMHDFVLDREPDWDALRARLERPFANAIAEALTNVAILLDRLPGACDEAMKLARFACTNNAAGLREFAELAELPCAPFATTDELEAARQAHLCLANLLLTANGTLRKRVDISNGFPPDRKREKQRFIDLKDTLAAIPGFEAALAALRCLPPAHYSEDEWQIVRACFTLLRHAAGELQVVFAESGVLDFIEVAQLAQRVLADEDGLPTDAALALADGIHHLLVDEFQDTSRRQHALISSLVAAWPDATRRTLFVVGDPMQSIYFFRDADAELFPRVQSVGLELPHGDAHRFEFVPLASNFRTVPLLVDKLNQAFTLVFSESDGSDVRFSPAQAARAQAMAADTHFDLHLEFVPQGSRSVTSNPSATTARQDAEEQRATARSSQTEEIVSLIRKHTSAIEEARSRGEKYRVAVLGRTRSALSPIAAALREAGISFRAIDLEPLSNRPEVLDALALARALFNAEDRVAWLGVLRAPWCGLSLADLHALTSAENDLILHQPVPTLLASRAEMLSEAGRIAAARVLHGMSDASGMRAHLPTSAIGTWLQQVWQRLGGIDCVDAAAKANLDLLWSCLDALPEGEPDLLGPSLVAALEKLNAQPDPAADSECGVQLMTIHKSKGLEFEVVIVPELQAGCGYTRGRLLSWLERGLAHPDDSGEITEFLIAPLPAKGTDRGEAKAWVDRVYRARESQETRRILYVAATRAREELHLFARPAYKLDSNGALSLCEPTGSLLSTAWPAVQEEVRARFEDWTRQQPGANLTSIAASADSNVLTMPSAAMPALLRRLPADYRSPAAPSLPTQSQEGPALFDADRLYKRHEGGLLSRALGTAVHRCFEELANLRLTHVWDQARAHLTRITPRIAAHIRAAGIDSQAASAMADQACAIALQASEDPHAEWILSPHADASNEVRWAGELRGGLRSVQVDRVFRAGLEPQSHGEQAWWIIDYKTTQLEGQPSATSLSELRSFFAPQLELYAEVLRLLHGKSAIIRAGIYYPRMLSFDWWEL